MGELVLDNERRREVSDALGLPFGRVTGPAPDRRAAHDDGELATALGVEKPYVMIVVDELERQGLVERRPHPTDRRVKLVATTARGSAAARRANEILGRLPAGLAALATPDVEKWPASPRRSRVDGR